MSAFQAIREPGSVQIVIVAGIPPDLELAEGGRVGWASAQQRAAHYDVVLADPRMRRWSAATDRTCCAPPDGDFPRASERGRALCEVRRAPSTREPDGVTRFDGDGFYFDRAWCPPSPDSTMVMFTERAQPLMG